jgi:bacillolysin
VIEFIYDDFPDETGWTLIDGAGTLIASQSTGSFRTLLGGSIYKTASVAESEYIFEMTDAVGDGICCQHGIGEFKITVNGELIAVGGNGNFGDGIQTTFSAVASPISARTIPIAKDEDSGAAAILGGVIGAKATVAALVCSS